MPVDFSNPQQVQAFKASVISEGADPVQADQFIASQIAALPAPVAAEPKSVGGFLGNVVKSGADAIGGVGSALINVLNPDMENNTVAGVAKLALGTGQLLIPGEQGLEKYPKAVADFYKNRYGSLEAIGNTLYNDPVGALLDASVVADLGGSAIGKLGEISKINKLVKAGKTIKDVGQAVDPLRIVTKGVGKALNPTVAKAGEFIEDQGTAMRQGVSKIYMPADIYGAGKEAAVANTLDKRGLFGSAQAKYEKLQPVMEKIGGEIADQLDAKPVPIEKSMVDLAFKEKVASTLRTSDLSTPQAQKMMNKYLSDLSDVPVDEMTSRDLFGLKRVVNGDTTQIYEKLSRGTPLTPKEQVILAFRNTLDDVIGQTNPEVKQLTIEQSHLYDAADSLNRSRKTVPTMRIAGTTVPASVMQTGQDVAGVGTQALGKRLQNGRIPAVGLTPTSKGLYLSSRGNEQLHQKNQNGGNDVTDNNAANSQSDEQLNTDNNHTNSFSADTTKSIAQPEYLNPFGASPQQIYAAYIQTAQTGNTKKAAIIKQMYSDEVSFQKSQKTQSKSLPASAAKELSDIKNSTEMLVRLSTSIDTYKDTMGPLVGRLSQANVYNPTAQSFDAQMKIAAQVIGKSLEGGKLTDSDIERYRSMLPNITDTPKTAQGKLKNIQKTLNNIYKTKSDFYTNSSIIPDISAYLEPATINDEPQGGGGGGLGLGLDIQKHTYR